VPRAGSRDRSNPSGTKTARLIRLIYEERHFHRNADAYGALPRILLPFRRRSVGNSRHGQHEYSYAI